MLHEAKSCRRRVRLKATSLRRVAAEERRHHGTRGGSVLFRHKRRQVGEEDEEDDSHDPTLLQDIIKIRYLLHMHKLGINIDV